MLRFLKEKRASDHSEGNAGLLSSGGALTAAILASACCWLPLALVGTGASAAGAAGYFETYRPYFLALTVAILGFGFYFVYVRKPRCAPGEGCALPNPKVQRLNKITLWAATAMVVVVAAFPSYGSLLLGGDGQGAAAQAVASAPDSIERTYIISGMTCESCTAHVRSTIEALPGVQAVEVSYSGGMARVVFEPQAADDSAVSEAIKSIGYTGHVSE